MVTFLCPLIFFFRIKLNYTTKIKIGGYKLGKNLTKEDLKPIERDSPLMRKARKYGWLTKIPILKQIYRKKAHPRGYDVEAGQIIPINLNVGDYDTEAIYSDK